MVAELRAGAQSGAAEIGFDALQDATVRARVLKSLRLGYDFADLKEADQEQSKQVPMNLYCFTGQEPRSQEIEEFAAYTVEQNQRANE